MTNNAPKFQYKCSKGHGIYSEKEYTKCPVTPHGKTCNGTLTRFGPGSKTDTKEPKT